MYCINISSNHYYKTTHNYYKSSNHYFKPSKHYHKSSNHFYYYQKSQHVSFTKSIIHVHSSKAPAHNIGQEGKKGCLAFQSSFSLIFFWVLSSSELPLNPLSASAQKPLSATLRRQCYIKQTTEINHSSGLPKSV